MPETLPAYFIGHGNPMNALQDNAWTEGWAKIGRQTPRPRAILAISAHWFVTGTGVTISTAPRTIHDFGGFPRDLYHVQYPAPGDPDLARRVAAMLAPLPVVLDESWGLDHGTWSILTHTYPKADVPVVQLSIDATRPASFHLEVGQRLAPLRGERILILGSGNLVHNLRAYAWGEATAGPYDWAARFEEEARKVIVAGEFDPLVHYDRLGRDAMLSIPTPEHFLPLLYVLGTRQAGEAASFPIEGVDGGSISMLSVQVGGPA
ncbi:4,5-DOPA dioxygenase extradiol [Aquisphaera insulae]|uniref:4,5-DOPA-extradiol-dioxygenase n=1 Tax=Aquisphaera insulae TaxID=2712864 RepID=UPI0013EC0B03|nr:4,5-DOPA dioxygenase extradiol [Aquisphaera insulae]